MSNSNVTMTPSGQQPIVINAEIVIVNLLREDRETYLPIYRLQQLVDYIFKQLSDGRYLDGTPVVFDISFDSIERTVMYNNNVFELIGRTIHLKKDIKEIDGKCKPDPKLEKVIKAFCLSNAA